MNFGWVVVLRTMAAALVVAAALWVRWRWQHRRLLQLASCVPGPPPLPVVGNALKFMARPEEMLDVITSLIERHGDYVGFWLGPDFNILVKDPDDIRLLLTSNKVNQKGPVYKFMSEYIGSGILTGGGTWRISRKHANPSYGKKAIQNFMEIFNAESIHLADLLKSRNSAESFNVFTDVVKTTTLCVCQTLMGLSKDDLQNVYRMDEVILKTQGIYGQIFERMTKWWLQIPLIYWLLGEQKTQDYYIKLITDMSSDIVEKRKRALEANNNIHEDSTMGVVDRLLLCGELTPTELIFQTFSLFTTSQEAAAKIASTVLVFLAHLPDWQEKVYNEIIEVLGPEDRMITEEDIKQLRHLDMVYKEALRYMPIAALIQRTVEEEITIKNGEITIPAGTSLVIPLHNLHRDPRYWDEPNKVKPERFLPEHTKKRDPNAFVPFSLGAMDCLGDSNLTDTTVTKLTGRVYATALIKTLVVKVVREVILEADGDITDLELHVAISVKFSKGYNLRVRPRNKATVTESIFLRNNSNNEKPSAS